MATTVTNIHIGQGEIWVGGTPPTAGSDPNDPTAGTPSALNSMTSNYAGPTSGGAYVGFTFAPATLTYKPTYYMVVTEQAFAEVVVIPTNEEANLAFTILEATYQNVATAWGQGTTITGSGFQGVFVGSKLTLATQLFILMSRKRTGNGYFIASLYQGYSFDGAALGYERRVEQKLATNARGLADTTRPAGDQLFQLAFHDANPA